MKKLKKITVLLLAVVMVVTMLPVQTHAASKIQLNKTSTTLYVKNNTTLKISGTSKNAKWATSNRKVATVTSKGKVTAVKAGTAYIYAKIGKKTYKCKVKVKSPYLNQTTVKIERNEKYTLKLIGAKVKSLQSLNTGVATINSKGVITGKKPGKVMIFVTDTNNKVYKCIVTVTVTAAEATIIANCTHNWIEGKTVAATCEYDGYIQYKCSKCGTTKKTILPATGHKYQWKILIEPTTTELGLEEYRCTVCNRVKNTYTIPKLEAGNETNWVYSGDTRTKTMFDGTVVTETKYGTLWGWYNNDVARGMFMQVQKMQRQTYGDANVAIWDDSKVSEAKAAVLDYAYTGNSSKSMHVNSVGLPNLLDNSKYITFIDSHGLGDAMSCFVSDSVHDEQFTYGQYWRNKFGTYFSSAN